MWCTSQEQGANSNGLLAMLNLNTGGDKVRQTEPQNTNFMFLYQLKKENFNPHIKTKTCKGHSQSVRQSQHTSAGETVPPIYN